MVYKPWKLLTHLTLLLCLIGCDGHGDDIRHSRTGIVSLSETQEMLLVSHNDIPSLLVFIMFDHKAIQGARGGGGGGKYQRYFWGGRRDNSFSEFSEQGEAVLTLNGYHIHQENFDPALEMLVDNSLLERHETSEKINGAMSRQVHRDGVIKVTIRSYDWFPESAIRAKSNTYTLQPGGIAALYEDGTFIVLPYEFWGPDSDLDDPKTKLDLLHILETAIPKESDK